MEVDRKDLDSALRTVLSAVSNRPGIPALGGVLVRFDGRDATLTATDLETTATSHVSAVGAYTRGPFPPFVALIPGKLFASVVKKSTGERIEIERTDGKVRIGKVSLRLLPEDDFPNLEPLSPTGDPTFAGDLAAFVDALVCAESAASGDYARPVLTGTLFRVEGETLTLVGTDSYRLHLSTVKGLTWVPYNAPGRKAIVAAHGIIGEAKRERTRLKKSSGTVKLWLTESHATVAFPNGNTVTARLIEGEYPNYEQLIPDTHEGRLTFDPAEMAEAVKLTGLLARDTTPIRFDMNGTTTITASSPDMGEASAVVESAVWNGDHEGMSAAFNPTYFLEGLTASGASSFEIRDGLRPLILRGENRLALVMPVRMPVAVS
jgi:DNA polymerase-3 subunit beta